MALYVRQTNEGEVMRHSVCVAVLVLMFATSANADHHHHRNSGGDAAAGALIGGLVGGVIAGAIVSEQARQKPPRHVPRAHRIFSSTYHPTLEWKRWCWGTMGGQTVPSAIRGEWLCVSY